MTPELARDLLAPSPTLERHWQPASEEHLAALRALPALAALACDQLDSPTDSPAALEIFARASKAERRLAGIPGRRPDLPRADAEALYAIADDSAELCAALAACRLYLPRRKARNVAAQRAERAHRALSLSLQSLFSPTPENTTP